MTSAVAAADPALRVPKGNPRFIAHHAAAMQQPDWTTQVIDGGHDLMITQPAQLSDALLRIASSSLDG